jgi:glycine cleavage system H protein
MANLEELLFTPTHEWVKVDGDSVFVGVTDHAQEELGDVALVQMPEVGRVLQSGDGFGEIESIKAVSELYAPVGGEVVEVNETLSASPEQINIDPYGEGWIIKLRVSKPAELDALLDSSSYDALLKGL